MSCEVVKLASITQFPSVALLIIIIVWACAGIGRSRVVAPYTTVEEQKQILRLVFQLFKQQEDKVLVLHVRDNGNGKAAEKVLSP